MNATLPVMVELVRQQQNIKSVHRVFTQQDYADLALSRLDTEGAMDLSGIRFTTKRAEKLSVTITAMAQGKGRNVEVKIRRVKEYTELPNVENGFKQRLITKKERPYIYQIVLQDKTDKRWGYCENFRTLQQVGLRLTQIRKAVSRWEVIH